MLINSIILAVREMKRNLMRSILTVLGVVIGVASVVTMVTVGGGATIEVQRQISSLGSNVLMIVPGKRLGPGQSLGNVPFKKSDAEFIKRNITSVLAVAPLSSGSMRAIFRNENWSTQVTGTDNNFFVVTNREIAIGRYFTESELRSGRAVCIIGETVRRKLFKFDNPIGERIRLEKLSCEVIGLLKEKGQSAMGFDQDDLIILPLTTFHRRISGNEDVSMIQVAFEEGASVERIKRDIEVLMRERRHLSFNQESNFHIMDPRELMNMITGTTQLLTALLSAVAGVSLLVGGIGIMNIMLVSVTERTREIGIRLAIGALEHEVLFQFLIEAVCLSSFGGIIGILMAVIFSIVLSKILGVPFVLKPGIMFIAFVFSAVVGIIFGYFPALKAAKLNPIDALRHE
ncbi:MAG: ABC transporter permease [Deltaproteobacteria bacterium]|nr:ABC transporter permease [Deltaproteobacteria bacterium]